MKKMKWSEFSLVLVAIIGVAAIAGCVLPVAADKFPPTVISTNQATATFSEPMKLATITAANFTVKQGATDVPGTVAYDTESKVAIFTPTAPFAIHTSYTATITTGVKDSAGNAMAANKVWTFTTFGAPQAVVNLGSAANFAILAKTAISTVPKSAITGDIGVSPAAQSYITGFSLTGVGVKPLAYATSTQVTGKVYAADSYPSKMTAAISDMQTAYVDAHGRTTTDVLNLGTGNIGGLTLVPGLYTWGTNVTIPSNVTFAGGVSDIWILQISGKLTMSSTVKILLAGGAKAKNIFWQVAGGATFGVGSHFEGNMLSMTGITVMTGGSVNGRLLAQSKVALQKATVVKPAP